MAGLLSIAFVIVWFFAALWLARRLTGLMNAGILRSTLTALAVVVLAALPLTDEIIGGFQFRELCRERALLKIDETKIKGKMVRMVSDPANKDIDGTAVRIYYTRVSYRDATTQEELGSNGYLVAMGGYLIRTLAGGHEMTPMTIFPSTCSGPGNLPTSMKYEFNIETKTVGTTR